MTTQPKKPKRTRKPSGAAASSPADPALAGPTPEEREGYVPNVVYSCGSMIHRGRVIMPYAMSDSRTTFATVGADRLIDHLLRAGP